MKHETSMVSRSRLGNGDRGRLYLFPNGYGASLSWDTRYQWNLAVVRTFDLDREPEHRVFRWDDRSDPVAIDYTTPVTADVVRLEGLDGDEMNDLLDEIAGLPAGKE